MAVCYFLFPRIMVHTRSWMCVGVLPSIWWTSKNEAHLPRFRYFPSLTWEAKAFSISATCSGWKQSLLVTCTLLASGGRVGIGRKEDSLESLHGVLLVLEAPVVPPLCAEAVRYEPCHLLCVYTCAFSVSAIHTYICGNSYRSYMVPVRIFRHLLKKKLQCGLKVNANTYE